MFWGYAAWQCIIDNTNLARLRGAGSRAVIVPEMEAFSQRYGFQIRLPRDRSSQSKSGQRTKFLDRGDELPPWPHLRQPGRPQRASAAVGHRADGTSAADQGASDSGQAVRARASLSEATATHLPAPYQAHQRGTDQYGYVAFAANYYWVPGTRRDDVKVLQYADRLKIFQQSTCLAEYPLPADGVRGQHYSPPGQPQPRHQPKNRHRDAQQEEQRLRALGREVAAYLDFALKAPGVQRHRFTRELFALSRKVTPGVLIKCAQRALHYRIVDLATVRRIAWLCISQEDGRASRGGGG